MFEALLQNANTAKKPLSLSRTAYNPRPLAASHVSITSANDKIYAYGGLTVSISSAADFHAFNPATNVWTTLATPGSPRRSAGLGYFNGKIYLYGGLDHSTGVIFSNVLSYDIVANTWQTTGLAAGALRHDFSSVVIGSRFYCFGGWNGGPVSTNAYYAMDTNTWVPIADQAGIRYSGCATDGINIYLVGGQLDSGMLNTVYRYNIASNTFSTLKVLPTASNSCGVMVVDNYLVCYSGYNNGGYNSALYAMDLAKEEWATFPYDGPTQGIEGSCQLGRSLYLVGGYNNSTRVGTTNKIQAL